MSCLMDIRIIPLDRNESISQYVAKTIQIIKESGLRHHLAPSSACVEGEWDELMALATKCFKENAASSNHLLTDIRMTWRKGRKRLLDS